MALVNYLIFYELQSNVVTIAAEHNCIFILTSHNLNQMVTYIKNNEKTINSVQKIFSVRINPSSFKLIEGLT
jgi:hypothetical protein